MTNTPPRATLTDLLPQSTRPTTSDIPILILNQKILILNQNLLSDNATLRDQVEYLLGMAKDLTSKVEYLLEANKELLEANKEREATQASRRAARRECNHLALVPASQVAIEATNNAHDVAVHRDGAAELAAEALHPYPQPIGRETL